MFQPFHVKFSSASNLLTQYL
jgi:hypothetical protein